MAERAYKRFLRFLAEQPGGEAEMYPAGCGYSRKVREFCEERQLIVPGRSRGWLTVYRITDAGRAEIADPPSEGRDAG